MSAPTPQLQQPTVREAADAVFLPEEKQKLKENLIEEQIQQARYLREHPEIERVLRQAISKLAQEQPEDPVAALTAFLSDENLDEVDRLCVTSERHKQWLASQKKNSPSSSQSR